MFYSTEEAVYCLFFGGQEKHTAIIWNKKDLLQQQQQRPQQQSHTCSSIFSKGIAKLFYLQ